jgi:hypothetical protein
MIATRAAAAITACAAVCAVLAAAPPAPPRPASYNVVIRYRIVAFQNERVAQFDAMMKDLAARGFRRDPNDEAPLDEAADVRAVRLRGTVPAASARLLLHERHVQAILLIPAGDKLPEEAAQPVRVTLDLATGLPPDRQRMLHAQTAEALAALKFTEAVGYDHRGFTRLVGSMPADQLESALSDLRVPGKTLPPPFAVVRAIRMVEASPGIPAPPNRPALPAVPQGQEKLSSELRDVLGDAARAGQPLRFEIILADLPPDRDIGLERLIRATAPGIALEGRVGTIITVVGKPSQFTAIAALPEVAGLRVPRAALVVPIKDGTDEASALIAKGFECLHTPGYKGKGNRLAVLAADFRGWEALIGKGLPKGTRLIDLTRERNENLEPDPYPSESGPGQGTLFARIASAAAPEADLILIRVDPAAPYMLHTIARAIDGEPTESLALAQRGRELNDARALIDARRTELLEERRQVFADLREEGEAVKRRDDYRKNQAILDQDADAFERRLRRYLDLQAAFLSLKGVRVVASALVWDDGRTGGGSSALSRFFDSRPFPRSLWIQPASVKRGRIWTGLFRDEEGNGAMKFAPAEKALPDGSWSRDLNFLSWQAGDGKVAPDFPAGTRVRLTLQWREAHDANLLRIGQDPYREPLHNLRLVVLRQPDPAGTKQPADDLEVAVQSTGAARRLDQSASSATYEISVEWRVPAAGRYAVRVEGRLADSDRPAYLPTLPSLRRTGEVRPRMVLETLEGSGHAIWRDYPGEGLLNPCATEETNTSDACMGDEPAAARRPASRATATPPSRP